MKKWCAILLALALLLVCAGCGDTGASGEAVATSMRLEKTEGDVTVRDAQGKAQQPREKLPLFSGYGIETAGASLSWFNLDDTKLLKMDENSDAAIEQEDKHLRLVVNAGRVYFNVTEPLADDETFEISTGTMVVGIRGTSGWVDAEENAVYILQGAVTCRSDAMELDVPIEFFMCARCDADGAILPGGFDPTEIPEFVWNEMDQDLFDEFGLSPNRDDLFAPPTPRPESAPASSEAASAPKQTAYGSGAFSIEGECPSEYDESYTDTVTFTYVDGVMTYAEYDMFDGKGGWGDGMNPIEDQPYYDLTVEELVETLERQGYTVTIR